MGTETKEEKKGVKRERPIQPEHHLRNPLQPPLKAQGFALHRAHLLENKVIVSF